KIIHSVEELKSYQGKLIWLNIDGLHNEKLMGELTDSLQIPPEILSDVMEPGTRPQTEEFDNGLFASIKMMQIDESLNQVSIANLSIIGRPLKLLICSNVSSVIWGDI
ncbi:MAG: CorA family divalent cation transporter, partial [Fermentimonas sp.]|nr:CorA family divalent cation transporter [Fermentimonas sp.]